MAELRPSGAPGPTAPPAPGPTAPPAFASLFPPGLHAIYGECRRLYPDQPNPLQVTAIVKYWLGGPDPLDYVSMYRNVGSPSANIPEHWHYISFGLSDLYGDNRVHEDIQCQDDYLHEMVEFPAKNRGSGPPSKSKAPLVLAQCGSAQQGLSRTLSEAKASQNFPLFSPPFWALLFQAYGSGLLCVGQTVDTSGSVDQLSPFAWAFPVCESIITDPKPKVRTIQKGIFKEILVLCVPLQVTIEYVDKLCEVRDCDILAFQLQKARRHREVMDPGELPAAAEWQEQAFRDSLTSLLCVLQPLSRQGSILDEERGFGEKELFHQLYLFYLSACYIPEALSNAR
ncbi:hypothetical protein H8959_011695 [Pygathrix nigripes]